MLKKFIEYYKPYKFLFYADLLCAFVLSGIDLAFPQILNYLTKNVFSKDANTIISTIPYIIICLLVMYIIRYFCQYFVTSWGHIMGARMESDMRKDLFTQFQNLSFSYYDKNNTGDMMSRLVSDLFDISELAHHGPENLFICTVKIIGSFILMFLLNAKMALILLVVTLCMIVFSYYQNKKMSKVFTLNRKKISSVNSTVQDSLSGIRVVKSFANEEVEHEKFDKSNHNFFESKKDSYLRMGKYHAGNSFFKGVLYTAVLASGGYLIAVGELIVSDLALFALYIGIFLQPIEVLINFTEQFQKGYAGFKRFVEIIDTASDINEVENPIVLKNTVGSINYKNVSFNYGDEKNVVLNNISLNIEPGKTIALIGPSGGGKSTICSLLPRFYDVKKGEILLDGENIKNYTLESLRENIGVVQQDTYMFSGSIKENILYGNPKASMEEVIWAAKQANIHDFIESLQDGYDTFVGQMGVRLSGGQKQRISIARVFLKNPKILILDEATSALDNESERYIQKSLDKLSKNRTTIVIAHRLSTIVGADEIAVILDGRITEKGNHTSLMEKNGLYAKYYNMQFEGFIG